MTVKPAAVLQLETANASGAAVTADDRESIVIAHQVAVETASLNAKVDTLTTENANLKSALDVAETAKATAEKALADYKAEVAAEIERASLVEARTAEVAKVAPALDATEDRVKRWTSMDQASFDHYVSELAAVAGKVSQTSGAAFDASTAETAMSAKKTPVTSTSSNSAGRAVLALN